MPVLPDIIPFPAELAAAKKEVRAKAIEYGLDFFPVIFEMCSFEQVNQIASYGGFPTRYPHWKWGMEYERMAKQHHYGLGRIYEMVINNDPCYAYLQESNPLVDQKLVIAHVYGHADFFKNNLWFGQTDRKMMDTTANHAARVRRHAERHGTAEVERWLDVCLSVEDLIDPHSVFVKRGPLEHERRDRRRPDPLDEGRFAAKDYMERYINPPDAVERARSANAEREQERDKTPARPTRDVLRYLLAHAPLEDWQADILGIIRDEAYYYAPQGMTKVMNEGWASYWHSTMMTRHFLDPADAVDYADHHSGTVHMPPGGFNPYKIGIELFRDIEQRWNTGRFGKDYDEADTLGERRDWHRPTNRGREKIFEVRRTHNDATFIDEFMTSDFIEKHKFYEYGRDPRTGRTRIVSRDPDRIKRRLLNRLTNMGRPFIYVADGNYANRGELYLAHQHSGLDIEIKYAVETLKNLVAIWGRPCHLQAKIDDEMVLFSHNGARPTHQIIHDELPQPAHGIT